MASTHAGIYSRVCGIHIVTRQVRVMLRSGGFSLQSRHHECSKEGIILRAWSSDHVRGIILDALEAEFIPRPLKAAHNRGALS